MAKLKDFAAKKLMNDAKAEMQKGREDALGELARSVERSWNYGEGKKTATKTAVGVGLAAGGAAIGVATHGVGIPIIIGLAAGGLAVGAMSDTAFAKLWGRQYTGGQRTREWLGHVPVADTFGQSKLLEVRAQDGTARVPAISDGVRESAVAQGGSPTSYELRSSLWHGDGNAARQAASRQGPALRFPSHVPVVSRA